MLWMAIEHSAAQRRPALSDADCEGLIQGIAAGDRAAFERFYQLTQRAVYAYALSLTRHPQNAQDVMMDTYLAVRVGAERYRPQGKPLAWVFTIVRNAAAMQYRRGNREAPLEDISEEMLAVEEDPLARVALQAALDTLDGEERHVVLLHAVSGLKHREIAAVLGRPLSTVLSKYNRALKKLRRQLEGVEDHEKANKSGN